MDLTTGDDQELDQKLEVKLRQYSSTVQSLNGTANKTGEYKVNFVDRDVFGNPIPEEENEVLFSRNGGNQRETPEERRARCMRDGTCFKCNAKDHKSYECPKRRRKEEASGSADTGKKKTPPPPHNNVKITFGPGTSNFGASGSRE